MPDVRPAASWSGKGRGSVLQLPTETGGLSLRFAPPKVKGGGGSVSTGSDADAVLLVVAAPLWAFFSWSDRRRVQQRVHRWRAALPGVDANR